MHAQPTTRTEAQPLVVHLTAPAASGGLESVVRSLAGAQLASGRPVEVVAVVDDPETHPFVRSLRDVGVPVRALHFPGRAYLREVAAITQLLRQLRPAVVHTHGYRSDVLGGMAARRVGVPTVSTVHGFTGGDRKNAVYEWLQTRAMRRANAVVAVSRPIVQRLTHAGVRENRIHTIQNAQAVSTSLVERSEARRALGVPAEGFLAGWVGRMTREKGADVMIEAIIAAANPSIGVAMVGDGPERPALESRSRDMRINVHWCGPVADAGRLFKAFDAFVLSSRTEGTPMVLLEAMAAGVPVVATMVGGVPDVVTTEEALLVPSESPAALGAAVSGVHLDPGPAAARAARALERLRTDFSIDRWVRRYDEVYAGIVRPHRE